MATTIVICHDQIDRAWVKRRYGFGLMNVTVLKVGDFIDRVSILSTAGARSVGAFVGNGDHTNPAPGDWWFRTDTDGMFVCSYEPGEVYDPFHGVMRVKDPVEIKVFDYATNSFARDQEEAGIKWELRTKTAKFSEHKLVNRVEDSQATLLERVKFGAEKPFIILNYDDINPDIEFIEIVRGQAVNPVLTGYVDDMLESVKIENGVMKLPFTPIPEHVPIGDDWRDLVQTFFDWGTIDGVSETDYSGARKFRVVEGSLVPWTGAPGADTLFLIGATESFISRESTEIVSDKGVVVVPRLVAHTKDPPYYYHENGRTYHYDVNGSFKDNPYWKTDPGDPGRWDWSGVEGSDITRRWMDAAQDFITDHSDRLKFTPSVITWPIETILDNNGEVSVVGFDDHYIDQIKDWVVLNAAFSRIDCGIVTYPTSYPWPRWYTNEEYEHKKNEVIPPADSYEEGDPIYEWNPTVSRPASRAQWGEVDWFPIDADQPVVTTNPWPPSSYKAEILTQGAVDDLNEKVKASNPDYSGNKQEENTRSEVDGADLVVISKDGIGKYLDGGRTRAGNELQRVMEGYWKFDKDKINGTEVPKFTLIDFTVKDDEKNQTWKSTPVKDTEIIYDIVKDPETGKDVIVETEVECTDQYVEREVFDDNGNLVFYYDENGDKRVKKEMVFEPAKIKHYETRLVGGAAKYLELNSSTKGIEKTDTFEPVDDTTYKVKGIYGFKFKIRSDYKFDIQVTIPVNGFEMLMKKFTQELYSMGWFNGSDYSCDESFSEFEFPNPWMALSGCLNTQVDELYTKKDGFLNWVVNNDVWRDECGPQDDREPDENGDVDPDALVEGLGRSWPRWTGKRINPFRPSGTMDNYVYLEDKAAPPTLFGLDENETGQVVPLDPTFNVESPLAKNSPLYSYVVGGQREWNETFLLPDELRVRLTITIKNPFYADSIEESIRNIIAEDLIDFVLCPNLKKLREAFSFSMYPIDYVYFLRKDDEDEDQTPENGDLIYIEHVDPLLDVNGDQEYVDHPDDSILDENGDQVLDENGDPVLREPLVDENGDPVLDVNGDPIYREYLFYTWYEPKHDSIVIKPTYRRTEYLDRYRRYLTLSHIGHDLSGVGVSTLMDSMDTLAEPKWKRWDPEAKWVYLNASTTNPNDRNPGTKSYDPFPSGSLVSNQVDYPGTRDFSKTWFYVNRLGDLVEKNGRTILSRDTLRSAFVGIPYVMVDWNATSGLYESQPGHYEGGWAYESLPQYGFNTNARPPGHSYRPFNYDFGKDDLHWTTPLKDWDLNGEADVETVLRYQHRSIWTVKSDFMDLQVLMQLRSQSASNGMNR